MYVSTLRFSSPPATLPFFLTRDTTCKLPHVQWGMSCVQALYSVQYRTVSRCPYSCSWPAVSQSLPTETFISSYFISSATYMHYLSIRRSKSSTTSLDDDDAMFWSCGWSERMHPNSWWTIPEIPLQLSWVWVTSLQYCIVYCILYAHKGRRQVTKKSRKM